MQLNGAIIDLVADESSAIETNTSATVTLAWENPIMKRLFLGGLSVLLLTAAVEPAVRAQDTTAINSATLSNTSSLKHLTPFELITLADRGNFKDQGIPGYYTLRLAYHQGTVSGKSLVAAAVQANLLDPKYLTDQDYLSYVETQLRFFEDEMFRQ